MKPSLLSALSLTGLLAAGCIARPGMNADCQWPPESAAALDLTKAADLRHLIVDAELIVELVDRHRFHGAEAQQACEVGLTAAVARSHGVSVSEIESARARISDKGLDLTVNVPVAVLFLVVVVLTIRLIERRFAGEPAPMAVTLIIASVLLSGLFVMVGEFWTSILQMIRVGSMHVGGRVRDLPWLRHERQVFTIAAIVFWIVALWRWLRSPRAARSQTASPGTR